MKTTPWKSRLYIATGFISIGVGVVGIWTPLLPTTEFLLLAAFCFSRGSERWHTWLMAHPTFSPYILAFRDKRGLTKEQKRRIAALVSITLGITAIFIPFRIGKGIAIGIWICLMVFLYFSATAAAPHKKLSVDN
ncbi:MAG: YbaN family protein [Blastocatellia bacterium]